MIEDIAYEAAMTETEKKERRKLLSKYFSIE